MERGHITQSDAPHQEISTKQAIGVCMCLICFALIQRPITDIPRGISQAHQAVSVLHNSFPENRTEASSSAKSDPAPAKSLRLLDGEMRETRLGKPFSDRVLAYLAKAEVSEPDAWMRDDIRVAWLTVLRCAQNVPDPWRYSFWTYYGTVPEKAIPYWQQRTADREWMLGRVAAYEKSKKQNRPAITYMPKKEGVA